MSETGTVDRSIKVAYLVNQYPAVSHSFIRREILALEAQGVSVERFSIRPPPSALIDPADQAEQRKTRVLLDAGALGLLLALARAALLSPLAWVRALGAALRLGGRSDRGRLRHLIYFAEACLLRLRLRAAGGVRHLHAHFGTNSAAVAMLTRMLGGPTYSFTVHGPEEFDHPAELSLGEKIERRLRELALHDRVRITGWASGDTVRSEMLAARVLLLPSFAEGLPVVLMEALALGRPAISTYVAGIPELIESGVNGWLIPAGSIDALVRAIRDALDTPVADLTRMGRAGAEAAQARHDAHREAGRLAALFREVAG